MKEIKKKLDLIIQADITNINALSITETIDTIYLMRDLINQGKMLDALEICNEISDAIVILRDHLREKDARR